MCISGTANNAEALPSGQDNAIASAAVGGPGCNLEINVALSAIVPLWTAASLDSAMRMVQRYNAYRTSERHWRLRPQVRECPPDDSVWSNRATYVECARA